jgi:hypothetical protein
MAEIFKCEFTELVSALTMGQKSSSFEGIQNYKACLDWQFGLKVKIYQLDREITLQKPFEDHCHSEAIIIERPLPYTKESAGLPESGGHVVIEKACRMRIQAQFPEE